MMEQNEPKIENQSPNLESPNLLNIKDESGYPPPPPTGDFLVDSGDAEMSDKDTPATDWNAIERAFEAGEMGYDLKSNSVRQPEADEYIDDDGRIQHRFDKFMYPKKKQKRHLQPLETLEDVRLEMTRLYADFHHGRKTHTEFTKAVYALDCISRVIRMDTKQAIDIARRHN